MGVAGGRIALFLIALGMTANAMADGAASGQSIRFAEPVHLGLQGSATSFDAYGRRFSLSLENNERVLQKLPAQRKQQLARYRLLRGSLENTPGSWVRLTESSRGIEGAIWDGRELYAVTRHDQIADLLTTPLAVAPEQTVVYRLSDARNALPRDFCALTGDVAESQVTGLQQYQALMSEISGGIVTPTISRQLEISVIADQAFQAGEHDPTAAMMARLNIVEGIFSEQLGLLILATDVRLVADADPFTSTHGTTLLEQLGTYREANAAVRARGLAHLMTGKDLDGTTAGIAYIGTVCEVKRGVSVSQRSYGTTISALIMAHELGHNLGAGHDGVAGGSCANVGEGFIMSPSVSGYATFSHCSMDSMRPVLAAASCVTPAQFADVEISTGTNAVTGEGGRSFTLPFNVRSTGNLNAESTEVAVTLPANAAIIESASSSLGSCSVAGQTATCALGELAEAASAQLSVVARGNDAMSFNVLATVTASNDRMTSNNRAVLPVSLRSGIDAAVSLTASATEITMGSPLQFHLDVSARRSLAVRNATLSLNLNQSINAAAVTGGQCTVNSRSLTCQIDEIPAGTTRRLTVETVLAAGPVYANAIISAPGDGDMHNNSASLSAWVQAERDVELTTAAAVTQMNVGALHEIPFTLRSRGSAPTGDVALLISLPAATLVVESIDAAGAVCATPGENLLRCEFGTLAPGASREVRLNVRGTAPLAADLVASAVTGGDGFVANNNASVPLRIDHDVDLAITQASGAGGIEGLGFEGQVTLQSLGRKAATGATLDIELHAAGMLRSASIHRGTDCELLSATRARCTLPTMTRNTQIHVDYEARFSEPGDYDVTFSARAPGDTAPDSDQLMRAVLVRPYLDAAVRGSLNMDGLYGGQSRDKAFTVTVDRRALPSARFVAAHARPALAVEAISAGTGECRVDVALGGVCDFADLPAGSSTSVNVTYRAAGEPAVAHPVVSVSTPGDVASDNNMLTARVETFGGTDVELRVAAAFSGAKSAALSFPVIELRNGGNKAISPSLEVSIPAQLSVIDVSASNAVCSGTTTLRCDFDHLDPWASSTVTLTVRASAGGRFVSLVRVRSANDNNADNDTREVAIEIAGEPAQPAPSADSSQGSGGGGRMEWLALMLLGALAGRRWRKPAMI